MLVKISLSLINERIFHVLRLEGPMNLKSPKSVLRLGAHRTQIEESLTVTYICPKVKNYKLGYL